MKFIISNSTASSLNDKMSDLVKVFGIDAKNEMTEVKQFKNFSVTRQGDDWVYELDDGLLFKYMHVYMKVARFVAMFIEPVKALLASLKDDMQEIQDFVTETKE